MYKDSSKSLVKGQSSNCSFFCIRPNVNDDNDVLNLNAEKLRSNNNNSNNNIANDHINSHDSDNRNENNLCVSNLYIDNSIDVDNVNFVNSCDFFNQIITNNNTKPNSQKPVSTINIHADDAYKVLRDLRNWSTQY